MMNARPPMRRPYERLSDAADVTRDERYRGGPVGIWYARAELLPALMDGLVAARERGLALTRARLEETHVYLGSIDAADASEAYALMSGDRWSPHAEANAWLRALGTGHTSMFIGDVIDIGGELLFVEFEGFAEMAPAEREEG